VTAVIRQLSARLRLTLLYTALVAVCGGALVTATYLLVAHNLPTDSVAGRTPEQVKALIQTCVQNATASSQPSPDAKQKCAALYTSGLKIGVNAQRGTVLDDLLTYSLLTLAAVIVIAALAGWLLAGRILRPVHQITDAARAATEQNLGHRLALRGPRDELRRLADTFDDMLDRLERAFTGQRQFIANASHELRTPLTVMRTTIDVVLAKPAPSAEELTAVCREVRQEIDHADRLMEALLMLARTEQAPRAAEDLDLATIAEDALDARPLADVVTIAALDAAPVKGDPVLLERLVTNLLENAGRYNVDGGSVAISTARENGSAVLRVVNTGPVVAPGDVDRLFQPFTRLHDRTGCVGFGLGLALVSSITTMHNGTVRASAVPTGGLDVSVRFPVRTEAVALSGPS
jgi:signal transduction histidine kinase